MSGGIYSTTVRLRAGGTVAADNTLVDGEVTAGRRANPAAPLSLSVRLATGQSQAADGKVARGGGDVKDSRLLLGINGQQVVSGAINVDLAYDLYMRST